MKKTPLYYYLLPFLLALIIVWLLTGDYGLAWLSVAATAGSIAGSIMFVIGIVLLIFRRITLGSLLALTLVALLLGITFSFEEIGFGFMRAYKQRNLPDSTVQKKIDFGRGKQLWVSQGQGETIYTNFMVDGKNSFSRLELFKILSRDLQSQLNMEVKVYAMYISLSDELVSPRKHFIDLQLDYYNDEQLPYGGFYANDAIKKSDANWRVTSFKNNKFVFQTIPQQDEADKVGRFVDRREVKVTRGEPGVSTDFGLSLFLNKTNDYVYIRGNDQKQCAYRYPNSDNYIPMDTVNPANGFMSDDKEKYLYTYVDEPSVDFNVLYCGTDDKHVYHIIPIIESYDGDSIKVIIRQYERL
ncbi:MAG: hypothetical protein Q7S64_01255 [bacterium]|nr:hypothetical protein [bacterium]